MIISTLSKVILENFQSIQQFSEVKIKPITILVGPNSAGKSSIYDVLSIFEMLFIKEKANNNALENNLKKWVRAKINPKENELPPDLYAEDRSGKVGITIDVGTDGGNLNDDFISDGNFGCYYLPAGNTKLEILYEIQIGHPTYVKSFTVKLDNEIIISLETYKNDREHKIILKIKDNFIDLSSDINFLKEDANNELEILKYEDSTYIYECILFLDYSLISPKDIFNKEGYVRHPLHELFIAFYKECFDFIAFIVSMALDTELPTVSAIRTIPNKEDLIYCFYNQHGFFPSEISTASKKLISSFEIGANEVDNLFKQIQTKINSDKNNFYWEWIANSFALKKIEENNPFDDENKYHISSKFKDRLNKINEYLSQDLFAGDGYQVAVDILKVGLEREYGDRFYYKHLPAPFISKLYLVNSNGVYLDFEDVGSGISFIIPALASLVTEGLSRIQQPELHLHPSLQGVFADILIDSTEFNQKNYPSIIETHSEHFILRLLRLIRDKKNKKQNMFSVSAEDISISYFLPVITNNITKSKFGISSTVIKDIRISEDGTFVDEWPNGFFMERYKDIFDE